ncbi:unnamed protein product [Clavelina lepadiformis]|uniref:VWFA domain-containing protein n=1 Tax=Clavelina lepadiformis TaxID=159417 RepID=A0ABP0FVL8_CLALP
MRNYILCVFILSCAVQVYSQGCSGLFGRFDPGCGSKPPQATNKPPQTQPPRTQPPRTQPPRTQPPRTQPPRTQPPRTEPPQKPTCKERKWGPCDTSKSPFMQKTVDKCRPEKERVCKDGALLASLLIDSIVQPPSPTTGGSQTVAASFEVGAIGARNLNLGNEEEEEETCTELRGENGQVIGGKCSSGSSTGDRRKRSTQTPKQTKRDLLIMLDESGSVGPERFELLKRMAAAIVKLLCDQIRVHRSYTRVSILSFDRQIELHVRLRDNYRLDYDANFLAKHIIKNIRYKHHSAGSTCLNNALRYAWNVALSNRYGGRRGQRDVEQDIILITDGCANCVGHNPKEDIRQTARFLRQQGVHTYVIGVNLKNNCKDILRILAQGGRCFHFFYLDDWQYDVSEFLYQLENPPQDVCLNVFERPDGQCLAPLGK